MTRRTGPYPRVPALCNECGTQREVAWRTVCKGGRYKCATCKGQTSHAIVAPADWGDYWERDNEKNRDAINEVENLIEHMTDHGVRVFKYDLLGRGSGEHWGIKRYLDRDDDCWHIFVEETLTVAGQLDALESAWRRILPSSWWDQWTIRSTDDEGRLYWVTMTCFACKAGRPCAEVVPAELRDGVR